MVSDIFAMTIIISFVITFLPFLLWKSNMLLFFEYNPFILQTRQGHLTDLLLMIAIGIYVIVTFIHNMYLHDNWNELFESAYDITYFGMALPFLCAYIGRLSITDAKDQL